jgi:hypothetical protein
VTPLAARIIDALASSRVPLFANDLAHRLQTGVAEVMIALYELEQSGAVVSKLRGAKLRRYYEIAE